MILADITVSLKNPLFSIDHIIAFIGIILNIGTLVFAIYSNLKANAGTTERQKKLEEHQSIIENTQKEISSNLNSTAATLSRINKSITQLNQEQEELANRISSIQVVMLQTEYKSFFSKLRDHDLHVRELLIIINEYQEKGFSLERTSSFRSALSKFNTDFTFFANYNAEYGIKETFPQMLVLNFSKLDRKYMATYEKISDTKNVKGCFPLIQDYSKVLDLFWNKVSAK
ncbi:hypothetical protein [Limosilactobacillus caecicola]|uniref:hypothetical protein n=1 Tax=Limosilactobacillus caecicola TaxID=2941332 RepID=UPI00203FEF76|nr:hypothetical protein [Limosilactobacillus caecicola]